MDAPNAEEMEQFQRLSDHYQPDLPVGGVFSYIVNDTHRDKGPLVGNKESIAELVHEYARADPQFIAKTSSLSRSHFAYRKIKGDGQCGWRGATFGYFEIILGAGDMGFVDQEEIRIRSFEQTMKMVGINYELMEDMFDPTWELFTAIRKAVERQDKDDRVILEFYNDEIKSNSIVYHFKMMTSAYMQLRPDNYEPFLEMSIQDYRVSRIDPTNQEIDQVGLQILTDGVISPARIAVDVLYLDRSSGEEVTPYEFVPDGRAWPAIRLLYRPGHYDLIYKDNQPIRVFAQTGLIPVNTFSDLDTNASDPYLNSFMFPNTTMQDVGPRLSQSTQSSAYSSHHFQNQYYGADARYDCYNYRQRTEYQLPIHSHPASPYPYPVTPRHLSQDQDHHTNQRSIPSTPSSLPPSSMQEPQIRLNPNVYEIALQGHNLLPLNHTAYGSDANSQAHFRHSQFQPQVWNAKYEYGRL